MLYYSQYYFISEEGDFSFASHFVSSSHIPKRTSWQSPRTSSRETIYKNECEPSFCLFFVFLLLSMCLSESNYLNTGDTFNCWTTTNENYMFVKSGSNRYSRLFSQMRWNQMEWAFSWTETCTWLKPGARAAGYEPGLLLSVAGLARVEHVTGSFIS